MQSNEARHEQIMQAEDERPGPKPLTVKAREAADLLGISIDSFERYVEAEIDVLRIGRMKLIPYAELERYVSSNAYRVRAGW